MHFRHDDALKNAKVEVAVAGVVVVAIRGSAVPGVVVPATAVIDPVGTIADRYPSEVFKRDNLFKQIPIAFHSGSLLFSHAPVILSTSLMWLIAYSNCLFRSCVQRSDSPIVVSPYLLKSWTLRSH